MKESYDKIAPNSEINSLSFNLNVNANDPPVLKFDSNGIIYVNGRPVSDDEEIITGMRELVRGNRSSDAQFAQDVRATKSITEVIELLNNTSKVKNSKGGTSDGVKLADYLYQFLDMDARDLQVGRILSAQLRAFTRTSGLRQQIAYLLAIRQ